jgi:hypothetical protein
VSGDGIQQSHGVSRRRRGCSGLFSENESSQVESHARVRCQRVNSAAYQKIPQLTYSTDATANVDLP